MIHFGLARRPTIGIGVDYNRKEVIRVNDSKNVLTSKTAWVFALLLLVGAAKALGLVDFELDDNEAEGIALGIVAIIGIALRLITDKRVRVLPIR